MEVILNNPEETLKVVKRMVFLAWNACGRPMGLGILQDMRLINNPVDEEQIWKCAYNQEDYLMRHTNSNEVYCDYVFGRMMKWGCKWKDNIITIPERIFRYDYQSFCGTYPNNKSLVTTTIESLDIKNYEIKESTNA